MNLGIYKALCVDLALCTLCLVTNRQSISGWQSKAPLPIWVERKDLEVYDCVQAKAYHEHSALRSTYFCNRQRYVCRILVITRHAPSSAIIIILVGLLVHTNWFEQSVAQERPIMRLNYHNNITTYGTYRNPTQDKILQETYVLGH